MSNIVSCLHKFYNVNFIPEFISVSGIKKKDVVFSSFNSKDYGFRNMHQLCRKFTLFILDKE